VAKIEKKQNLTAETLRHRDRRRETTKAAVLGSVTVSTDGGIRRAQRE